MKDATLIAIIAIVVELLGSIYYLLTVFEVVNYNPLVGKAMQLLFILSHIGLLVFFVQLYKRQK